MKVVDGYAQLAMDRYKRDSVFNALHRYGRWNSARASFRKPACL